jgi:capsular polysaccharide export protein
VQLILKTEHGSINEVALLERLRSVGWVPGCEVRGYAFSLRKLQLLREWVRPWSFGAKPRAQHDDLVFVWGAASTTNLARPIRVEDGMIRSIGLGIDLVRPLSWVFDTRGIYFDATRPSDLECILKSVQRTPKELKRASALRLQLIEQRITKYNLCGRYWRRPANAQHVVLVAGQVESDASIQLGCNAVRSNQALLELVRKRRPSSYVVYKPHPDVVAGMRSGALARRYSSGAELYDELITDVGIDQLYPLIDELHVMTSLAGFEALLRGVRVTCYGMPFYAGWGLSEDLNMSEEVLARRGRKLTIDELVAGVLLDYASYRSPLDGSIWQAEQALEWLATAARYPQQNSIWFLLRRKLLRAYLKMKGRF